MYQERENEKRPGTAHTLNKLKGVWHASDVTPQKTEGLLLFEWKKVPNDMESNLKD